MMLVSSSLETSAPLAALLDVLPPALATGAILSALLAAVILGSLRLNAEMWLGDYPPDIRRAFGAMSAVARRQRLVTGTLFLAVLVAVPALGLARLAADTDLGFARPFFFTLVVLTVFNLLDLLVIDWLLMVRLKPRWIVLPGTEGLAGYDDYGFHFRAFLIGVAGSFGAAALVGLGFWLL